MFIESLFLEAPKFEKVAVTVKLPDDQSKWSPKILSELYRQVPVMEAFHSTIILDRVDSKKGVGFGYITSQPKTINPLMSNSLPKIKIPIIINSWQLSPFDIFFTSEGKGLPLTEKRVNEVLMRAAPFDSAQPKIDGFGQDVRTMLTPPWENVGQFHRGLNTQVKTSSYILPRLSNTVHNTDLLKLASWVKSDEGRASLYGDQEIKDTFLSALRLNPIQSFTKEASASGPVVKQYRWDGGQLMTVKVAQPQGFQPNQQAQPTQQAAAQMSPEQQSQVQQEGSSTEAPPMAVMSPQEMEMDMVMLGSMYAPSDSITLMGMAMFEDKEMSLTTYQGQMPMMGGNGMSSTSMSMGQMGARSRVGEFDTDSSGLSSIGLSALIRISSNEHFRWHAQIGIENSVGENDVRGDVLTPMSTRKKMILPYGMQSGDDSTSLITAITGVWASNAWVFGGQVRRSTGLGDEIWQFGDKTSITAWSQRAISDDFSLSLRLNYSDQDEINGRNTLIMAPVQTANPLNYGGSSLDIGIGFNWLFPVSNTHLTLPTKA